MAAVVDARVLMGKRTAVSRLSLQIGDTIERAIFPAQVGEVWPRRQGPSCRSDDDVVRGPRASMAIDVFDQPAAQGIESSLRNFARDLRLSARCRREELRAEDIADRIALECAADASRIPVHILEAAVAIVRWRDADKIGR